MARRLVEFFIEVCLESEKIKDNGCEVEKENKRKIIIFLLFSIVCLVRKEKKITKHHSHFLPFSFFFLGK